MARPPSYVSIPDKSGIFRVGERESLYYELQGSAASSTKAGNDLGGATDKEPSKKGGRREVLVMGAFGTLRWVDLLADKLAAEGYQVLSYNHRGIGGGCCGTRGGAENQVEEEAQGEEDERATWGDLGHHHTCELLIQDGWRLIDHVWGDSANEKIHLYGASMGGFVVQQMALQDLRSRCRRGPTPAAHRVPFHGRHVARHLSDAGSGCAESLVPANPLPHWAHSLGDALLDCTQQGTHAATFARELLFARLLSLGARVERRLHAHGVGAGLG